MFSKLTEKPEESPPTETGVENAGFHTLTTHNPHSQSRLSHLYPLHGTTSDPPPNPQNFLLLLLLLNRQTPKCSFFPHHYHRCSPYHYHRRFPHHYRPPVILFHHIEGFSRVQITNSLHNPTPRNNNKSYNRKTPHRVQPLPPSGPVRRSSRLQNSTPVSYSEVHLSKKNLSLEGDNELITEGAKQEVYTEEHEKLLGDTNMSWTLFVDGYGKDGKRIYDPVRGKTCHQCRQKTLGHRTNCCKCSMVQGQFCDDCLYMRYGENVLEANQNPDWICPPCRGICNCSLCRQAKGWPPTGTLYRKISSLGFKSVVHYLIQTKRAHADLENIPSNKKPASAKRSLPISDEEPTSPKNESTESSNDLQGLEKPEARDNLSSWSKRCLNYGKPNKFR